MTKTKEMIYRISLTALMMALVYLATQFLAIPYSNGGYFNLSDALIMFTAIYIGPLEGLIAGIAGCVVADLLSGSNGVFVPFTIIAKGLEALIAFGLYYLLRNKKHLKYIALPISATFMILTYFVVYCVLFDIKYAYISSLFDLIQGYTGSLLAYLLLKAFQKIPLPFRSNANKKDEQ